MDAGLRSDDGRIVSNLAIQALAGRPLTIYGTGEQTDPSAMSAI